MSHDTNVPTNPPIPDPALPAPSGPNLELPPINPARAKSTLAALMFLVGVASTLFADGGIGEILAEIGAVLGVLTTESDRIVGALNVLWMTVAAVWGYLERAAPHRRISFRAPIREHPVTRAIAARDPAYFRAPPRGYDRGH